MPYYRQHVFLCTQQRDDGHPCCGQSNARELRVYMKQRCKALGIKGPGAVCISSSGCMGRCMEGPVMVVYPESVWYNVKNQADIDEIIAQHLMQNQVVTRLLLPDVAPL